MSDWFDQLAWFDSEQFQSVLEYVDAELQAGHRVLPEPELFLRAYDLTPLNRVRVVILGQDPYPTPGHATGLAFSVSPETNPLPKSLANIYSELELDFGPPPSTGCLEGWARQGVLLLNTSLSVRAGEAGSHAKIGWMGLVDETIRLINKETENTVFILWGNHAQTKVLLVSPRRHHVITSPHPSPLSAHRGFFGSRPFSRANEYLSKHGRGNIDWSAE